ncbi:MAG: hypothetical protein ACTHWA_13520, partial [Arachnia sp.]
ADRWVIHIDHDTGQPVITPPGRTEKFRGRNGSNEASEVHDDLASRTPLRDSHIVDGALL